jgi:acyl-CoA thioesterase I
MKKLMVVLLACLFMFSCSGGGGGSEPVQDTKEEIVAPVTPEPEPTPIEEVKIPTDLTSDEWLALEIEYTPAKPQFAQKLRNGEEQTIVIMGTSLSANTRYSSWVRLMREELTNLFGDKVSVINLAKEKTSSEYGISILPEVLAEQPDVVFIEYAINDSSEFRGMSIQDCYDNLDIIVQTILTNFPDCEIIIQTTNPTFREGTRVYLADYYQTYRYYAASRELLFIDYYPAWLEAFKDDPDLYKQYYFDTTHPNLEGTEAVIMPILREYIY